MKNKFDIQSVNTSSRRQNGTKWKEQTEHIEVLNN